MVVSSERHITTEGFTMYGISADRSEDLAVAEYTAYPQGHRYASRTVDLYAQCLEDFFGWRSRTRRRVGGVQTRRSYQLRVRARTPWI
jgi:hypothetical protein